MLMGLCVFVAGVIAIAIASVRSSTESRRAGGRPGELIRGSEGGVSLFTSSLMLAGWAAVLVGLVFVFVSIIG